MIETLRALRLIISLLIPWGIKTLIAVITSTGGNVGVMSLVTWLAVALIICIGRTGLHFLR